MKIAVLMMQKNEHDLLPIWLDFNGFQFGFSNLYVWDNGSDVKCKEILREYERLGVNVVYWMNHEIDFRRKGVILGEKIKELDRTADYDFYLPLDCDEFVAVESGPSSVRFDMKAICAELSAYEDEGRPLGVEWAYYNIPDQPSRFLRTPHKKTIFRARTFRVMDHGYHEGRSQTSDEKVLTKLVYVHYHNKPHELVVEHSKAKLRPYFDIDDPSVLNEKVREGNRLAKLIVEPKSSYMTRFHNIESVELLNLSHFFSALGLNTPFYKKPS